MNINTDFLWYMLFNAKGFGPKTMYLIYEKIRKNDLSLETVFNMNKIDFEKTFPEIGKGKFGKANFESIKELNKEVLYQEYQELKNNKIEIIYPGHQLYPEKLLKEGTPFLLFCKGQLSLLESEGISIVGSRNASNQSLEISKQFASDLALQGKNVISGYAKGVDTNAHLGALEKDGTTTIVLSFGILEFSKKKIFENLRWEGNTLIVSQFQPKEKWNAKNAMIRNKLVCALSKAVIIIESGEEKDENGKMSGTFDAGNTALKMKIPLFVVSPESFKNSPLGNIELIKRGGIEIQPKDGILKILENLKRDTPNVKSDTTREQMSLFK